MFLFSWENVPGKDNGKLIEYLEQKYGVDWVRTAKIEKIDNNEIKIATENNYLSLKLNDEKTNMYLIFDDDRTDDGKTFELNAMIENGKLNIYTPENDTPKLIEFLSQKIESEWVKTAKIDKIDDRTIIVSTEKKSLSLTLNDEKTKVIIELFDGRTAEFKTSMVKGKLNIYGFGKNGWMERFMYRHIDPRKPKKPRQSKPLFRWSKIPGKDEEKLKNFLMKMYKQIGWIKEAKIHKIDDDKTINVTNGNNSLSLTLNGITSVTIKFDGHILDEFVVKKENDELNIYKIRIVNNIISKKKRRQNSSRKNQEKNPQEKIEELENFFIDYGFKGDLDKLDIKHNIDPDLEFEENRPLLLDLAYTKGMVSDKGETILEVFPMDHSGDDELVKENDLLILADKLRNDFNKEEGFIIKDINVLFDKCRSLITSDIRVEILGGRSGVEVAHEPFTPSIDHSKIKELIEMLKSKKKPKKPSDDEKPKNDDDEKVLTINSGDGSVTEYNDPTGRSLNLNS